MKYSGIYKECNRIRADCSDGTEEYFEPTVENLIYLLLNIKTKNVENALKGISRTFPELLVPEVELILKLS